MITHRTIEIHTKEQEQDKIKTILGYAGRHELIHRDDLVLNHNNNINS